MRYDLIEQTIFLEGERHTAYGIACGTVRVENISTDREAVLQLMRQCCCAGLSPCHLSDVVEDFLAGAFEGSAVPKK